MAEKFDPIAEEAARKYEQHKELVREELVNEGLVAEKEDARRQLTWDATRGLKHPEDELRIQESIHASKSDLELAHGTTEAQVAQSGRWAEQKLDKLQASAKSEAEAEGKTINLPENPQTPDQQ